MDPRVLDAMLPFYTDQFGNPHSRTHAYGWEAEKAVDEARKVGCLYSVICLVSDIDSVAYLQHVADLIGADSKDIVYTSGATETNNMAIKGIAHFYKDKKKHIITTQTVRC